jgi:hypothetical protein
MSGDCLDLGPGDLGLTPRGLHPCKPEYFCWIECVRIFARTRISLQRYLWAAFVQQLKSIGHCAISIKMRNFDITPNKLCRYIHICYVFANPSAKAYSLV